MTVEAKKRRKASVSPTQRTLAECRRRGFVAAITERWNPHAHIRQDLYGWIDLLALDPETGALYGIQTTSGDNAAARVAKIREWPHLEAWLRGGHAAQVWSWSKRGAAGKRKLWTLKVVDVAAQAAEVD